MLEFLLSEGIVDPLRMGWTAQSSLKIFSMLLENPCLKESDLLKLKFGQ